MWLLGNLRIKALALLACLVAATDSGGGTSSDSSGWHEEPVSSRDVTFSDIYKSVP